MAQPDYPETNDRIQNNDNEDEADGGAREGEALLQRRQHEEEGEDDDEEEGRECSSPWQSSSKSSIPMIMYLSLLMISLEFEESVQAVPTVRLYESAICQQYYHGLVDESKCKIKPVQQKLARVRGWQGLFDALPS